MMAIVQKINDCVRKFLDKIWDLEEIKNLVDL